MRRALAILILAVTTAPLLAQEKKPAKPYTMSAILEYIENGKRKTKPMVLAIGADEFRIGPTYLDKKKSIDEQGGVVIPTGTPFTIEQSTTGATGSINWGFGVSTNNRKSYLMVKTGDRLFLLRLTELGKATLFLSEVERHTKVKVASAAAARIP